jgi:hypothetical protein|tara:strand:+ start:342 stop:974 length:633 start_codon:yes stop_codon:yes gene_type:complete
MKVLIACEYSGKVRDAFTAAGHDAMSCDLLPSDSINGEHYQGDVFDLPLHDFDLMIAHPPCTYLTNSGVCHLHTDPKRWPKMFEGADFFKRLLNAPVPRIAIENPIMHGYAKKLIGGVQQDQLIQPYMFGHMEQKATCLWLKNLPDLVGTDDVKAQMLELPKRERERLHYLPPSPDRWKLRSTTYSGIADAMAAQWTNRLLQQPPIRRIA